MKTKEAIERVKARFDKWALDEEDLAALQALGLVPMESKDERIRKALIHLINEQDGFLTAINGISVKDIIAYLEKQKEQNLEDIEDKTVRKYMKLDKFTLANMLAERDKTNAEVIDAFENIEEQPAEWSEEDEYVINKVLNWAEIVNPTSTIFEKLPKEQFIERLKSLRPRHITYALDAQLAYDKDMNPIYPPINHWKPSKEQMKRLGSIIVALRKDHCDDMADFLAKLYHKLEKL